MDRSKILPRQGGGSAAAGVWRRDQDAPAARSLFISALIHFGDEILGVAEQHLSLVEIVEIIVDTGEAGLMPRLTKKDDCKPEII
jgi:hypothetical protein